MADKAQYVPAPPPPPPPAPVQAGQLAQQKQQEHPVPPAQQGQQTVHLNWCHFKSELSGKPYEDAEVYLLHPYDLMTAHHFVEGVTVRRSQIMVSFIRTNKHRLARVTKFI